MAARGRLLRWGIIGSGEIAKRFVKDLREHTADINEVASVLTRDLEKSAAFLRQNDIPLNRAFWDFDIFAASGIDVCYIATPHTTHVELATRCLEKGLHVLVEKPFGLETGGLVAAFDLARRKHLFVMEAVWTRFLPAMHRVVEAVRSEEVGDVWSIDLDLGFDGSGGPPRLMDPSVAGGALYDIGTYGLHLATMFSSSPSSLPPIPRILYTHSQRRPNGVDEVFIANLVYPSEGRDDVSLRMRLSVMEDTPSTIFIRGQKGYIVIEKPCHHPDSLVINGKREDHTKEGHGLHYQTREVYECILKGKTESPIVPWKESLHWSDTFSKIAAFEKSASRKH